MLKSGALYSSEEKLFGVDEEFFNRDLLSFSEEDNINVYNYPFICEKNGEDLLILLIVSGEVFLEMTNKLNLIGRDIIDLINSLSSGKRVNYNNNYKEILYLCSRLKSVNTYTRADFNNSITEINLVDDEKSLELELDKDTCLIIKEMLNKHINSMYSRLTNLI